MVTSPALPLPVIPTSEARAQLPDALRRFRTDGPLARPMVFGGHRRAEGVVIPFDLYVDLIPAIEDLKIAYLARERAATDEVGALADVASDLGLDPDDYR
jgi:antitoxin StbD